MKLRMNIRAVLIDDERPALRVMEIMLVKYPQIQVVGQYTNSVKAMEEIQNINVDVVFLDIDMPQMNGMETAARIRELSPHTEVVFVTAYEKYALQAYQFHPMDYILKPVEEERLDQLIHYFTLRHQEERPVTSDKRLIIQCFGEFNIKWEDQEPIKWRTKKTKEVFAYLVAHYNCKVTKEEVVGNLWPEEDPDKATKQFYNGIYYIRKTLYEYGIPNDRLMIDNTYNLVMNEVDLDLEKLEVLRKSSYNNFKEIEEVFSGMYFEKQDYTWADCKREEYFLFYQSCLLRLAAAYQENRRYAEEEEVLQKAMREDPLNEPAAIMLLQLYLLTKNKVKGIKLYTNYEKLLKEELKERPCKTIMECYYKLKAL